jgi:hypothetical protein
VEGAVTDALPCTNRNRANEVEVRPEDVPGGDAFAPEPPRAHSSCPPEDAAPDDAMSALGFLDTMDLGASELGGRWREAQS